MQSRSTSLCFPMLFATLGLALGIVTPGGTLGANEQTTFVIGVQDFEEYLPYSQYLHGEYKGFNRELLDRFANSQGYTFVYEPQPIKRLYRNLLNGDIDLKYPDNPYWNAEKKAFSNIVYSDSVTDYIDGVMVRPERLGMGVEQLRTLGVIAGFTPFAYQSPITLGQMSVSENHSYNGLLVQVMRGRLDGAYSNIAVSSYYLKKASNNPDALVFDPALPHTRSQRHLSSINYPGVIAEFNEFLKTHSEEIAELKARYGVEQGLTD